MPQFHQIGDAPARYELAEGRMQFLVSNEFLANGIEGEPVFAVEGKEPGRIVGQLPDSDGSPLSEGQWSPSIRFLPAWVEFDLSGHNEPDMHLRIELREQVPRLVELSFLARPDQDEVRQKHLRAVELASLVNTVYRHWIFEVRDVWRDQPGGMAIPAIGDKQHALLRNLVDDMRTGRRNIDSRLLRQVAEVYRTNFEKAPVEAVARQFGVKPRMAHEYVRRAREHGFLPQTTQGKKKI